MSADTAAMATQPITERSETMGNIATPFNGPGGKPVKVSAEERDELARLGVDFGDKAPAANPDDEEKTS